MIGPVITPFGRMAQNEERWRGYLRRVRSGESQGMALLYDETSSVIYGLALRIVYDPSTAADVVLEVYRQVWSFPAKVEESNSVLGSLTLITRRCALGRRPDGESRSAATTPLPTPESVFGQERDLVIRALELLDAGQREAIELAFFSGMKDVELAQALEVSPQVIRARISAGMRKLNDVLKLVSSTEGNA
jgi:RNA polymerase sigma-70 factor, ECF subfamily